MSPAKSKALLVRNCGQLLTLRGPHRPRRGREQIDLNMIRDGAVLIRGDSIVAVGADREIRKSVEARWAVELDACGQVVLPGFIDSHTHALFAAPRLDDYVARLQGSNYSQIGQAGGGIRASARHIRSAGESSLCRRLQQAIDLFLEHGTTTAEVKSGYGLEITQELKMLRAIRVVAGRTAFDLIPTLLIQDVPDAFRRRRRSYLDLVIRRLIPQVVRQGLAEFFDVFCDRGYFSLSETKLLLAAASQAGLQLKLHAEQLGPSGAARMASAFKAVSVDHLDHLADVDMSRLRKTSTIATLLPGSVLHLSSGRYPSARRLIEEGIPVALATNFNPGSSPTANMQLILSLACSQMRMLPEETISAATINGAYAVGRGHLCGSLEPGKRADVCIMDVEDYREIPYFFGMNHASTVLKKGRVMYSKSAPRGGR